MDNPDIGQFYATCDAAHREFFSTLIHEWTQAGLPWNWTDSGNIALCGRTAMREQYPVLFVLDSGAGGKKETIRMRLNVWRENLGYAEADRFINAFQGIDGLKWVERDGEIVLPTLGHASGSIQYQFRQHIQALALRLKDLIGL